jgi:hypothetical protein
VREHEEDAVADEEHGVELGEGSSGRPTMTKRRWTLSMLTTRLCYDQYRFRSIKRGEENVPHVLCERKVLCDFPHAHDDIKLKREILRKFTFHTNDVVGTELRDVLDLVLGRGGCAGLKAEGDDEDDCVIAL